MYRNTKIASCCYCGARAALVLDRGRHELVCPSCGAPLHELKAMPVKSDAAPKRAPGARGAGQGGHAARTASPRDGRPDRPKKHKRKKSRMKRMFEEVFDEAFDLLEDIFD